MKEVFGTITKQFTLAPVRDRNSSYVFSGPTNILGFSNLSNLSLNYFFSLAIPSWLLAHPCQRGYYTFLVRYDAKGRNLGMGSSLMIRT